MEEESEFRLSENGRKKAGIRISLNAFSRQAGENEERLSLSLAHSLGRQSIECTYWLCVTGMEDLHTKKRKRKELRAGRGSVMLNITQWVRSGPEFVRSLESA